MVLPIPSGYQIATFQSVMSALATIRHPGDPADAAPVLPEIAISAVQESNPTDSAGPPHYIRLEVRLDMGQFGNAVEQRQGSLYLGPGAARRVAAAVERALGRGCRVAVPEPVTQAHHPTLDLQATLTSREREVLQLLAAGSTARESSNLLGISPRTVEFHRENIKEKLGVRSIAELTRIAVDAGMVRAAA